MCIRDSAVVLLFLLKAKPSSIMAPSLEALKEASTDIPVKVLSKNMNGTNGATTIQPDDADKLDHVLKVFRCLIADLCEQFKGGHPGGAMGMAGIGISLWKYVMRYSPSNPAYFNRDRFVLSNGKKRYPSVWVE